MTKLNKLSKILGEYFLGIGTHGRYKRRRAFYGEFTKEPYELKLKKRDSYVIETLDIGIRKLGATLVDLSCMAYAVIYKNPSFLLGIPIIEFCRGAVSLIDRIGNKNFERLEKKVALMDEKVIETVDEIDKLREELDEDRYGLYSDWANREED